MKTISMSDPRPTQKLYPLSLFVRLVNQQLTGCLHVISESISWSIYLENGRLTFATNSDRPLERLQRHLQLLSSQVPTLTNSICTQFCQRSALGTNSKTHHSDYQVVQWLVDQNYLDLTQATQLIEALAKDVIAPFLLMTEGSYEFISQKKVNGTAGLCHLELRPLVESCQKQLRRQQNLAQTAIVASPPAAVVEPVERQEVIPVELSNSIGHSVTQAVQKEVYTIACIDDSTTNLEAINSFLGEANFSVVMINDPLKALMQVIRTKPDVVLMDVGMPNLNGYELCSLMRRHPSFKDIPIIMVTGHTGFIDRAKAKLAGASGYLTKPFTRSELLKMVFKYLTEQ